MVRQLPSHRVRTVRSLPRPLWPMGGRGHARGMAGNGLDVESGRRGMARISGVPGWVRILPPLLGLVEGFLAAALGATHPAIRAVGNGTTDGIVSFRAPLLTVRDCCKP